MISYIPAYEIDNALPVTIEPNHKYKPALDPHALCLTVFLSPSSFLQATDVAAGTKETFDIKIDVFFNGSLCGSHYVPKRFSSETYAMTEQIVRFTGRRLGRLIEKPWIIVPAGQNPDGGLREHRRGKVAYAGAQQRWKDISDALMAEADNMGRDGKGERPVLGEYLETLAELPMPLEVEDMQKAGGPKFGVLDAVVTWGTGYKDGPDSPYITEPTATRIEGCTSTHPNPSPSAHNVKPTTTTARSTYTAPQSRSEALASARPIDDYPRASALPSTPSLIRTANERKPNPYAPSPSSTRRPFPPHLPFETPVKRSRGPYYDIVTSKQTLCEEMDSIELASKFKHGPATAGGNNNNNNSGNKNAAVQMAKARTTRASFASAMAGSSSGSPLSSAPATSVGKGKGTALTGNTASRPEHMASPLVPFGERKPAATSSKGKGKERAAPPPQMQTTNGEALDRDFVVPALSQDCRVTYAAPGVVRNVGATRGGVFKERGVVMGARFLIGG